MDFWIRILNILQVKMEVPAMYGWYHLLWLGITAGLTVLLCTRYRHCRPETVQRVVFWVAVVVALLELYKQVVLTLRVSDGTIVAKYPWHIFPWQFCSTPLYMGLLTGVFRKGKIHDALYAYLATFVVFAGLCVMLCPGDVFMNLVGINIQTMICHGSMIVVGVWLLATGSVPLNCASVWKASGVFAASLGLAIVLNEVMWYSGILGDQIFNMFYVSPHFPGTLAVYWVVQKAVAYPWCLIVYVAVFTAAAFLVMLSVRAIFREKEKDIAQCDIFC